MAKLLVNFLFVIICVFSIISKGNSDNARNEYCSFAIVSIEQDSPLTDHSGISIFTLNSPLINSQYSSDDNLQFSELQLNATNIQRFVEKPDPSNVETGNVVYKLYSNSSRPAIGQFRSDFDPCEIITNTNQVHGLFGIGDKMNTLMGLVVPTNGNDYYEIYNLMTTNIDYYEPCVTLNQGDHIALYSETQNSGVFCFQKKILNNFSCAGKITYVGYSNMRPHILKLENPNRSFYTPYDKLFKNYFRRVMEIRKVDKDDNPNYYEIFNGYSILYYMNQHPCSVADGTDIPFYKINGYSNNSTSTKEYVSNESHVGNFVRIRDYAI